MGGGKGEGEWGGWCRWVSLNEQPVVNRQEYTMNSCTQNFGVQSLNTCVHSTFLGHPDK